MDNTNTYDDMSSVDSKIESARKTFSIRSKYRMEQGGGVYLRVPASMCYDLGIAKLGYEEVPKSLDAWTQVQEGKFGIYQAFWIPALQKNPKNQEKLEENPDIIKTRVSGYSKRNPRKFFIPKNSRLIQQMGLEPLFEGEQKEVVARVRTEYNKHGYYMVAWIPTKQFNSKVSPFEPFRTAEELSEDEVTL